jgi:hypothetical protein
MARNMLEGWRRIGRTIQAIACVAIGIIMYDEIPSYVKATYLTLSPKHPFSLLSQDELEKYECGYFSDNASETVQRTIILGINVKTTLCFKSMYFKESQRNLIPYKIGGLKKDFAWGGAKRTDVVNSYIKERAHNFSIPSKDEEVLSKKFADSQWDAKLNILYAIGGMFIILEIIFASAGWIVRGFLGIKRGADHREEDTE